MLRANSTDSSPFGSGERAFGSDSPVTVALFTRSPKDSITRQSAGTLSPSSSSTTSPGTSAAAGSCAIAPARSAFTCCGSRPRSAATARSALYSCQNENSPFTRMTPRMATPSRPMPSPGAKCSAVKASAAASHRMIAKKCVNSRAKRSQSGSRATSSTRFGPYSASRRAASAPDRPPGPLLRLSSAPSTVSSWMRMVRQDTPRAAASGASTTRGSEFIRTTFG